MTSLVSLGTKKLMSVGVLMSATLAILLLSQFAQAEDVLYDNTATGNCRIVATGDLVTFEGCNLAVNNGMGHTYAGINGLGNILVGYDADDGNDSKSGSHNLVIGDNHSYASYGGFVAGEDNAIMSPFSSVLGGHDNAATATTPVARSPRWVGAPTTERKD